MKSGDGRFLNLDLNLNLATADGGESAEEEYDLEEAKLQKVLAEARYTLSEKFFALPDYAVVFDSYDFNGLATEVLNKLGKSFESYAPIEVGLEVDLHLLEHIIACVWKMPGGRLAFNTWLEDVFATSMAGIRNIGGGAVVVELILVDAAKDGFFSETVAALPHSIVFSSAAQ